MSILYYLVNESTRNMLNRMPSHVEAPVINDDQQRVWLEFTSHLNTLGIQYPEINYIRVSPQETLVKYGVHDKEGFWFNCDYHSYGCKYTVAYRKETGWIWYLNEDTIFENGQMKSSSLSKDQLFDHLVTSMLLLHSDPNFDPLNFVGDYGEMKDAFDEILLNNRKRK